MRQRIRVWLIALVVGVALAGNPATVSAVDRHAGYYYPEPQTREIYEARSETLPDANRGARLEFVNELTAQMLSAPYPPQVALFAKGAEAEKLIIVSLYDNGYGTLYRARGLLAMMTAISRRTPFFRDYDLGGVFTFFDLLVLFGFTQLTISDGDAFAHQVFFTKPGTTPQDERSGRPGPS